MKRQMRKYSRILPTDIGWGHAVCWQEKLDKKIKEFGLTDKFALSKDCRYSIKPVYGSQINGDILFSSVLEEFEIFYGKAGIDHKSKQLVLKQHSHLLAYTFCLLPEIIIQYADRISMENLLFRS
jgi:hypothetical protein